MEWLSKGLTLYPTSQLARWLTLLLARSSPGRQLLYMMGGRTCSLFGFSVLDGAELLLPSASCGRRAGMQHIA